MTATTLIPIFVILMILVLQRQRSVLVAILTSKKHKKKGNKREMFELAKQFIGKECIIYTVTNAQISGFIKEVSENALRIESGKTNEIINLEFVVRIREYPKDKNGKKKSVILD